MARAIRRVELAFAFPTITMTSLTLIFVLSPATLMIAYLMAVELLAPLATNCIYVTSVWREGAGRIVQDQLLRTHKLATSPAFAIEPGHTLLLVQRRMPSGRGFGRPLAIINHTTSQRLVTSRWIPVILSLAMVAATMIMTVLADYAYLMTSAELATFWIGNVVVLVVSVLTLKRQLDLHAIVTAIEKNAEPFLILDAEYSDST